MQGITRHIQKIIFGYEEVTKDNYSNIRLKTRKKNNKIRTYAHMSLLITKILNLMMIGEQCITLKNGGITQKKYHSSIPIIIALRTSAEMNARMTFDALTMFVVLMMLNQIITFVIIMRFTYIHFDRRLQRPPQLSGRCMVLKTSEKLQGDDIGTSNVVVPFDYYTKFNANTTKFTLLTVTN